VLAGINALARARLASDLVHERLHLGSLSYKEVRVNLIANARRSERPMV
jgi:hypothetical protein